MSFDVVAAGRVRRIPVGDAQEYALAGTAVLEGVGAEEPVAHAVLDPGGLHVARPVADVEMEAGI